MLVAVDHVVAEARVAVLVAVQVAVPHRVRSVAVHKRVVVVRRSANVAKIKTIRHR